MLRMNRLIAPAGMALLSVTLAVVPALLDATGSQLRFCSRMAAISGAWNQISNVFLAVYQPSNTAQLLAFGYGVEDRSASPAVECSGRGEQVASLNRPATDDESNPTVAISVPESSVTFDW